MILILTLIDWILFVPLALCVAYLLVYAIASKFYRAPHYPEADQIAPHRRLLPGLPGRQSHH